MEIPKKIFLIGFMGCGKSTHGKKLAKALNRPFVDLDHYIERKEDKSIPEIFKHKGEDYFRAKESEYLEQVVRRYDSSVISLGGGTPCFNNNDEFIFKSGLAIYVSMPPEALLHRLSQSENKRPLLTGKNEEENLEIIKSLLQQRESTYEKAPIKVKGIDLTTEKILEELSLFIGKSQ